jgi:hypothetical protein
MALNMKDEAHQPDRLALLSFWLILPVVIVILTWLGFHAIFQYYAPYGRAVTFPVANLGEPLERVTAVEVWDRKTVIQPFVAEINGLGRIDLQTVAWGDQPRLHNVFWHLSEIGNDGTKILKRNGNFPANSLKDREFVSLKFQPIVDSACKRYEVSFSTAGTPQSKSMSFPIYKTQAHLIPEVMPRIDSGDLKEIQTYPQGALKGLIYYFYERFG